MKGKIVVMLINYRVYEDGKFLDNLERCRLKDPGPPVQPTRLLRQRI
jgi:hypothetical protein